MAYIPTTVKILLKRYQNFVIRALQRFFLLYMLWEVYHRMVGKHHVYNEVMEIIVSWCSCILISNLFDFFRSIFFFFVLRNQIKSKLPICSGVVWPRDSLRYCKLSWGQFKLLHWIKIWLQLRNQVRRYKLIKLMKVRPV